MKTDEQLIAARDTTFDGVVPERLWIGVRNTGEEHKLEVVAEINGIEKVLWSMKPSYAERANGIVSYYTNLSWVLSRANPPRVEGFPEAEFNQLVAMLPPVVRAHCEVAARWGFAQGTLAPQPAPDERMGFSLPDAIKRLNGATIVNLSEPSPGDLERLLNANRELLAEVKGLHAEREFWGRMEKRQAPTEPTREQMFVERMRELGQAMPPNAVSMEIQKALRKLEAPFAEKGGSTDG